MVTLISPLAAVATGGVTCPPIRLASNDRPDDGLGLGLALGLGLGLGLALGLGLGLGLALGLGLGLGLTLGLGLALGLGLGLGVAVKPMNTPLSIALPPLFIAIVDPTTT